MQLSVHKVLNSISSIEMEGAVWHIIGESREETEHENRPRDSVLKTLKEAFPFWGELYKMFLFLLSCRFHQ